MTENTDPHPMRGELGAERADLFEQREERIRATQPLQSEPESMLDHILAEHEKGNHNLAVDQKGQNLVK